MGCDIIEINLVETISKSNLYLYFSYPSDAVHTLKKMPKGHVMDDPCGYVRLNFLRYPSESRQIYGDQRGCFEPPSDTMKPNNEIDCPDITPLTLTDHTTTVNREAMNDIDPLVHPDSPSLTRYCLGTKLQMDPKRKSHKSPTCAFHNAALSKQGRLLKTMTQEALQNCRKFRTIQVRTSSAGRATLGDTS